MCSSGSIYVELHMGEYQKHPPFLPMCHALLLLAALLIKPLL